MNTESTIMALQNEAARLQLVNRLLDFIQTGKSSLTVESGTLAPEEVAVTPVVPEKTATRTKRKLIRLREFTSALKNDIERLAGEYGLSDTAIAAKIERYRRVSCVGNTVGKYRRAAGIAEPGTRTNLPPNFEWTEDQKLEEKRAQGSLF